MAKKEYPIPGTGRKLIVDTSSTPPNITDENGQPVKSIPMDGLKLHIPHAGGVNANFVSVPDGTTFTTQHNPTCNWYYILGQWYYICT